MLKELSVSNQREREQSDFVVMPSEPKIICLVPSYSTCLFGQGLELELDNIFRDLSPETLPNVPGLSSQQWTPLTIRANNRQFQIPLDAPVHSPITRVFIVDGAKRAEDINVTLTRSQFDGFAIYHAHDFFELYPLKHSGNNIQYELQLKKPLVDKFKAHDQVTAICQVCRLDFEN